MGEINNINNFKEGFKMTQFYIGVKIITAWPQDKDGKPGYGVKYEDGYTSWSPKDTFDKAYFPMGESNNNKVTQEMVDAFIGKAVGTRRIDEKTVLVEVDTISGFKQYETSSCVDPDNFDLTIGMEIGLERIKNILWKCLGFVVQWGRFGLKQ